MKIILLFNISCKFMFNDSFKSCKRCFNAINFFNFLFFENRDVNELKLNRERTSLIKSSFVSFIVLLSLTVYIFIKCVSKFTIVK